MLVNTAVKISSETKACESVTGWKNYNRLLLSLKSTANCPDIRQFLKKNVALPYYYVGLIILSYVKNKVKLRLHDRFQ